MSTSDSDQQRIYNNLKQMCEFRGARLTEFLPDSGFNEKMESDQHVRIRAERSASDIRGAAHILIIMFSTRREIDSTSSKFTPFIARIIREKPKDNIEFNIILVSIAPISNSLIALIRSESKNGIFIEHHLAVRFSIVVPRNIAVPPHTIVSRADVEKIRKEMHIDESHFPKLIAGTVNPDPVAVWLGLRPGMIVRVDRPCETAGCETVYRLCI